MAQIPKAAEKFEIQAYRRPKDFQELRKNHVAFTGSPRKHYYDENRIVLVIDPYSSNTFYYEFKQSDIAYVEELPSLVSLDGESILMTRIWIKKGTVAIRCTPFVVENIMEA